MPAILIMLALFSFLNPTLLGQQAQQRPPVTPGPMLEQGTITVETSEFELTLVRSSQTVAALKPKGLEAGDEGLDFTPGDLLEASQIDGATPIKFLTRVLIPLSWNVIAALFVIQFVYTWNMFLWPSLIIRDESRQVVQVALQTLTNVDGALTYGPLMLAAIIASIPPAIVFVVMQKPFMSGFAVGQNK